MKLILIILQIYFFDLFPGEKQFYQDYQLIVVQPETNEHLQLIKSFENNDQIDLWTEILKINQSIKISSNRKQIDKIKNACHHSKMNFKIIENNLEKLIQKSNYLSKQFQKRSQRSILNSFKINHLNQYLNYQQIVRFLHEQNQRTNQKKNLTSLFSIGKTYENRSIWTIRIGKPTARRQILIDCGIHAREFISPSTCLFMIEKFINEIHNDYSSFLSLYNIFIIPLLNPDGYEYAFTQRRLWRKNRSPNGHYYHRNSNCIGVDLNRNFGYHWMENGASQNPCSETYAGPYENSEPETESLQKFIKRYLYQWDAYLTFHSYGQYWIYPWGFALKVPDDHLELKTKATIGSEALKRVNGTLYKIGSSANLLYESAGGSDDWAKGVANIKYVYTVELRPSDDMNDIHSHFAFILPSTFIQPVGQETFIGVKEFLRSLSFSKKISQKYF